MGIARRPVVARLIGQFSTEPHGAALAALADLNGDGKKEVLMLQTAGQMQSQVYPAEVLARTGVDAADQALFCLTAVDLSGKVLWQIGSPWDRAYPYTGHGGSHMMLTEDIDADGRVEVVIATHGRLRVLDGATGREKASTALPADNFPHLTSAQLGEKSRGRQIICKVNDRAYEPWEYSNPIVIYNSDLSVHREAFAVPGAGHNIVPMDVDGDGRDELFIGYSLLDHDGKVLWSLDLGEGFNYAREHADEIAVSDVDGRGNYEVRYAGSENLYVTDLKGRMLRTVEAGHSQATAAGAWGEGGARQVILSEKNLGLRGLDAAGKQVWHRTDINGYALCPVRWVDEKGERGEWALFRPGAKPSSDRPRVFERDVAFSRVLWPKFMDGTGALHEALPWRDENVQPSALIRAQRSYDAGVIYNVIVEDFDGDGLDELVVFDRRRVWVFGVG